MVQNSGKLSVRPTERVELTGWRAFEVLIQRHPRLAKSDPVQPLSAAGHESPHSGTVAPPAQHMALQNPRLCPLSHLKGS